MPDRRKRIEPSVFYWRVFSGVIWLATGAGGAAFLWDVSVLWRVIAVAFIAIGLSTLAFVYTRSRT